MEVDDLKLANQLANSKTLIIIILIRLAQAYTRSLPRVCVILDLIRAAVRIENIKDIIANFKFKSE